jgi:hypothetical protein
MRYITVRSWDSTLDSVFSTLFANCFQGLIGAGTWLQRVVIVFLNRRKYSLIDLS